MPRKRLAPLTFALLPALASCAARSPAPPSPAAAEATRATPAAPPTSTPLPTPGIDLAALDRSVDPCQDFYAYACGGWMARTPIPPDRPAWYRSFSEIDERNLTLLREILEGYAAGKATDEPYADKLGDYYATCMDEEKAETASLAALRAELAKVEALADRKALPPLAAHLHLGGVDALFAFGSQQDFKDAQQVIGAADQGGLGLPDRDYYLKDDAKSRELRAAYREHAAKLLVLAGAPEPEAARAASAVLEIETALAKVSMARVDRRDPRKIYHRLERGGLEKIAPRFAWGAYFGALGQPDVQAINVAVPRFFEGLNALLAATPLPALKAYLRFHLVRAAAPTLGKAFVDESFRFRAKNLTGEEQILPRWKRCVNATDDALGQALGRAFVARTFGSDGKERALELIKGIERAFDENLAALDWMDAETRAQAKAKLGRVYNKIGFPSKWRSYDALEIDRGSYLGNRLRAAAFESRRDLAKIGKPLDRTEWYMSPSAVNAYYDASMNEMVFPAGILQPPFFQRAAGRAENYGGIGMVMGHELTHGFDDEGRKFDGAGNLREWWSPAVGKAFEERATCVVAQYEAYKVEGLSLNGKLTLGENIADIGGLEMAHRAFEREAGSEAPIAGFSAEQRFFLAFAQSWCANVRPPYARTLVTVDPHAPPRFRVNGSVANQPAFQRAFACTAGAPMAPEKRCSVW